MKNKALIIIAVSLLATLTTSLIWGHSSVSKSPARQATTRDWLVAGPGRVEPYSEDIKLGAEISGKLKQVFVEEGDHIRRGQVLAELVKVPAAA